MLSTACKNVINLYYQELDKNSFYPLNFLVLGRHGIIQILKWSNLTTLKKEAGLPTFTMSVGNWVEKTNAIGIMLNKSLENYCLIIF